MKTRKTLALAAASAAAFAFHLAQPPRLVAGPPPAPTCWDFSDLSQTERFGIGETFVASTAVINLIPYQLTLM